MLDWGGLRYEAYVTLYSSNVASLLDTAKLTANIKADMAGLLRDYYGSSYACTYDVTVDLGASESVGCSSTGRQWQHTSAVGGQVLLAFRLVCLTSPPFMSSSPPAQHVDLQHAAVAEHALPRRLPLHRHLLRQR